jgi:hypothetical protein
VEDGRKLRCRIWEGNGSGNAEETQNMGEMAEFVEMEQ